MSTAQENIDKRNRKRRWVSYQWVVRNVPFFLFLSLLAIVYIYNGHFADKTIRNTNRVVKEIKELKYEYKTLKSEVMFRSKESEMMQAVAPMGLKPLVAPPLILKDSIQ